MNRDQPPRGTGLRDWALLVLALVGIGYQQVSGQVSIPLLVVYMLMGGLPGVTTVLRLFRTFPDGLPSSRQALPSSATGPGPSPDTGPGGE